MIVWNMSVCVKEAMASASSEKPRKRWRREVATFGLVAGCMLGSIGLAYFFVERGTRPAPNYSRIEDGLYLGGLEERPPPGTRAVLNVCEFEDSYKVKHHKWSPIRDASPAPSLAWLKEQVDFVEAQQQAGRITYVHCRMGHSRGAMVVVAYTMRKNGWTRDAALAYVRERRPAIRPNPAFMKLLLDWEAALSR